MQNFDDVIDNLDTFLEGLTNAQDLDIDQYYKNLGVRIKKAREEAGYTLVQLAEKVGLTAAAVSNYEAGIRQVPVHILLNFASYLNKPIQSFLGPTAEPTFSIRETLIDTLERYTEAVYPRPIKELVDGKLTTVLPEQLIPVSPEICKGYDLALRVKANNLDMFNYYFIKLAKPKFEKHVRSLVRNNEVIIELKQDDWVFSRIGDSQEYEVVQFKNIKPSTITYYENIDLRTYNVAGIVLGRIERLGDM